MNRLTSVPNNIEPIMAMANGFCNSDPKSEEKSNGTIAMMVVNEVIIIGRKRRIPAVCIASTSGVPFLRNSLIESSFRMESFTTIPHVTIIPMADIKFKVCPNSHKEIKAKAISIGISINTISGCRKLSNWEQRIKYINRSETNRITVNSPIIFSFEKKLPEKSTSHPSFSCTVCFTSAISFGASDTSKKLIGIYSPFFPAVMLFKSSDDTTLTKLLKGI